LDEALGIVQRNGEKYYQAELYRLKGELLLAQSMGHNRESEIRNPHIAEAEACFSQSVQIAQQQKAKSWELRAAMSMARLYQKQERQNEARQLLTEIYNRFTEGFDTVDLRNAKVLLNELSE
jgi:predicted ATPase